MTEPSDDYLMGRFAAGDYAAFETLYGRHKDAVYRYFLRATDAASAADGHQETWARVVANSGRYRAQGRFRAWVFTIAHHVLMDQFRQPRTETVSEDEAVANGSPLRDAENLEAAERLDALIAACPPRSARPCCCTRRPASRSARSPPWPASPRKASRAGCATRWRS